jgi:hypothetical protein
VRAPWAGDGSGRYGAAVAAIDPDSIAQLLDYRRQLVALYAAVRASADPSAAHASWCGARRQLYATHEQSPVPAVEREHDGRWTCPLAPPGNRLDVAVRAGERLGQ